MYELWTISSDNFVNRGCKTVRDTVKKGEEIEKSSILCGAFKSTFGKLGTTFYLWRHDSFDVAENMKTIWLGQEGNHNLMKLII